MLNADLSICVSGLDRTDSVLVDGLEFDTVSQWETSASAIGQWEAELLQERLQELLHAATDENDGDTKTRVRRTNQNRCLGALRHNTHKKK